MIKVLKNHIIFQVFKILVSLCLLLFAIQLQAMPIIGTIEGNSLHWGNTIQSGGYLLPTAWQPVDKLSPTREWAAGTFLTKTSNKITLTGLVGSVDVPMQVVGLEYYLGSSSSYFHLGPDITASGLTICSEGEVTASSVKTIGQHCVSKSTFINTTGVDRTPFQFGRPIISINNKDIIDEFKNAKLASGLYTGTVYVKPAYAFRQPSSGIWTYRYIKSMPVTLSIKYTASILDSLEILGDGVITPQYDTAKKMVSGSTTYYIRAKGVFPDGLKLSFDTTHDYELGLTKVQPRKGSKAITPTIPYSIKCLGCGETNIVTRGKVNPTLPPDGPGRAIAVAGTSGDSVLLSFKIFYRGIRESMIESGYYADGFTVFFEPNL